MIVSALFAASLAQAAEPAGQAQAQAQEIAMGIMGDMKLRQNVTLNTNGAEPRQVIRMHPKPGSQASYTMANKQKMGMSMTGPDGSVIPLPGMDEMSPKVVIGMKNTVGQPLANGLVPVDISYTKIGVEDVPAEVKEQMMAGMAGMEGLSFRMMMSPDSGNIEQIDVSSRDPQMYEAMQSMADGFMTQMPQFPTEPVGVGATWTVNLDMNMAGMELLTTQKVTLQKIQGDTITYGVDFIMEQGDSAFDFPGMPPDAKVDITKFEGKGKGSFTTNLTTLASIGSTTTDLAMGMRMEMGGQGAMTMNMTVNQLTEIQPAK
jgi:hypothetical protein